MRIRLVVEYDGTDFHGFQRQPGLRTVEQVLEEALFQLTGQRVRVTGSGRTDAGVHALGQVVSFDTDAAIPPARYRWAINPFLPPDVQVIASDEATPNFHPRYQARHKTYRYLIYRSQEGYTMVRRYAHQYYGTLDYRRMEEAARLIAGRHDFRGFMASGSYVQDTVRNVYSLTLEESSLWLKIEITGDGFLYRMVRNLVGTMIEIGRGRMTCHDLQQVLTAGDRKLAGPTAPACGLYLVRVDYR